VEAGGNETAADVEQALPPRSGYRRRSARALGRLTDGLLGVRQGLLRSGPRIDREASAASARRVAAYGVYGGEGAGAMAAAARRLEDTRHSLTVALGALGEPTSELAPLTRAAGMEGGKLSNLNRLIESSPVGDAEWVLLLDDDVVLPNRFLDRLVLLAERFDLQLAQPALTHTSHTAWPVTRRRPCLLRRTRFVEMGPVVLMSRQAFATLAPFPEGGMGWGVCLHWAAVARREGWNVGIADAVPVRHDLRPPALGYEREEARAAARELLGAREHIGWRQADTVLASYRVL
jgi:hypothetical protein